MSHMSMYDQRRRRRGDPDDDPDDDDDKWETTADGRKILKDGHSIHVGLEMCDALQRCVATSAMAREARRVFSDADAATHRPGYRFPDAGGTGAFSRDAAERARAESIREMCDAWKTPPSASIHDALPAGSYPLNGAKAGDICTTDGRAGHLQEGDGGLVCVPDGLSHPSRADASHATDPRDQAYVEYCRRISDAWRTS
jgi:hypothetical protein